MQCGSDIRIKMDFDKESTNDDGRVLRYYDWVNGAFVLPFWGFNSGRVLGLRVSLGDA